MTKFYLALVILSVLLSGCNSSIYSNVPTAPIKSAPEKFEWQEFVSDEGGFKILFPNTPRQTFKENDTAQGKVKTTIFDAVSNEIDFEVRYADFPAEPDVNQNDLRSYYDFIRDNTLKLQSSTLLSERDFSLSGKQGREIIINLNGTYTIYRLFLVGRRIYQLTTKVEISRKGDSAVQTNSSKFLDSFQMLKK